MLEQIYFKKQPCKMVSIPSSSRLLVTSCGEQNGSIVRSTEFKDVCIEDNFKQFSVFDFEIANIMATGAVHLLKPVSFNNSDVDNLVGQVDTIAAGLDSAAQNAEE